MPGYWSVIVPVAKDNICQNPSFERGTAGWGTLTAGTIGTTSAVQRFGAWAGSYAPTSSSTAGCLGPTFTAGNGTAYSISCYIQGQNGIPYMLALGDSNGANLSGSVLFTGGGTWQRYSFSYTEASGATRRAVIRKNSSADTGVVYIDGLQIEPGSVTTYLDGDQEGCRWYGQPHNSASTRPGSAYQGGTVINLSNLGVNVLESPGMGMPPIENVAQNFAVADGAFFERSRAAPRVLTLTSLIPGTTWAGLHALRGTLIDTIKIDRIPPPGPIRFWYTGNGGTVALDAVYDGGMEFQTPDGFVETAAMRFVAYQPYWMNTTDDGTALPSFVNLGSVNFVARRDPSGQWGTLGQTAGSTIMGAGIIRVTALQWDQINGRLFVGGGFSTVAGTVTNNVAFWGSGANAWGTLTGGTINAGVQTQRVLAFAMNPAGTLYLGGAFNSVAGTQSSLVQWNGNFGTLPGGTVGSVVQALAYAPTGTLFIGGSFRSAAGTTAPGVIMYTGAAYGTLVGGTVDGAAGTTVYALALIGNTLYLGGVFSTVGGTLANNLASWNGATFGTLAGGVTNVGPAAQFSATFIQALGSTPDASLYVGGVFGSAGGGTALNVARWNGVQFSMLSSGLPNIGTAQVTAITSDTNGVVYVAGQFDAGTAGGVNIPNDLARWTGASWVPFDISFGASNVYNAFALAPDNTLYVGGAFSGTAQAASINTVVTASSANTYPKVVMRNTSGTNIQVRQLVNTTTNDQIYFNLQMLPGETCTLDLTGSRKVFTSDFRGTILSAILPGSNLTTFRLAPGTNTISFFATGTLSATALQTSLYWRERYWSSDEGGT